jgi:hypothetical protein
VVVVVGGAGAGDGGNGVIVTCGVDGDGGIVGGTVVVVVVVVVVLVERRGGEEPVVQPAAAQPSTANAKQPPRTPMVAQRKGLVGSLRSVSGCPATLDCVALLQPGRPARPNSPSPLKWSVLALDRTGIRGTRPGKGTAISIFRNYPAR